LVVSPNFGRLTEKSFFMVSGIDHHMNSVEDFACYFTPVVGNHFRNGAVSLAPHLDNQTVLAILK
jgi:hypothetical protein